MSSGDNLSLIKEWNNFERMKSNFSNGKTNQLSFEEGHPHSFPKDRKRSNSRSK